SYRERDDPANQCFTKTRRIMTNNNPWGALDAAAGKGELKLEPGVSEAVDQAFTPYEDSLETLIADTLDETTEYFGTPDNPLAVLLEKAFNERGKLLTDYLKEQLSQTQDFVKTAQDAAAAFRAAEGD
ncbi:hypothetical protein, partial [Mycobacterium sp.]|uniref:hypothetical protein n=1 Tax=Mycobacterium sp. TaxID=1785 RepID=UPI002D92E96C|nr:hypothetical protein [Mycobacterium sp.]